MRDWSTLQQPGRNSVRLFWAILCLIAAASADAQNAPGAAAGQAEQKQPPITQEIATADIVRANLETSYLAHPFSIRGLPSLIFECSLTPHFFVNQKSWPLAIVLTPKVVLRMFNEESTPVRSPSFMPRIAAYFWFQQTVRGTPTFYGSVTLSHHSNGQAGPFFNEDGSINHEDGSFSTNYFEFTVYATGFTKQVLGWSSLGLQWHPGFNEDPELRGRYGLLRLNFASTLVADLPFHGQVNLRISAILDDFQTSSENEFVQALERFPLSVSYSMTVPGIDLGVYAGYYVGHDYYNIFFDELIHVIQLGISGGFSPTLLKSEASD
jgi:hypothetical protein